MAHVLSCAVGRDAPNLYADTKRVQSLLNSERQRNGRFASACGPALEPDGKCGPLTVAAITTFQSIVLGWSGPSCDGKVDPGGKTWKRLNGNVAQASAVCGIQVTAGIQGRHSGLCRIN